MIQQDLTLQISQNNNFKLNNYNSLLQNEVQSNRNNSYNIISIRNDARKDYSSSPISINNNPKIIPQKQVLSCQKQQKSVGVAFDCQTSIKNKYNLNGKCMNNSTSQDKVASSNSKNENESLQKIMTQPNNKQYQVIVSNREYRNYSKGFNQLSGQSECQQIKSQSQRASDQKDESITYQHGGSKSLDQSTFKRTGSCPNNIVQGIQLNNLLHHSANQKPSSNIHSKGFNNFIIEQNNNDQQENNFKINRSQNQIGNTSNTTINQSYNKMNIQNNFISNKPNQMHQQQFNVSTQCNPQISQLSINHTRTLSNSLQNNQNTQNFDQSKLGKQYLDYIQNQPYIQNQIENKHQLQFQDLDQSTESNILKESRPNIIYNRQNCRHQLQIQNKKNIQGNINNQSHIKQITSTNERSKILINNYQQQQLQSKNNNSQTNLNEKYLTNQIKQQQVQYNSQPINYIQQKQVFNFSNNQNLIGICDSSIINNSINQRDISIIKPSNIQDISCFSRDQSIFFDANNKDLSINIRDLSVNMKDQSLQNIKKNDICMQTTNTSGFDLPKHLLQDNNIIQNFDKQEYPTLSYQNLNNSKSLILEGLQDSSINFSKVEDLQNILEQEKHRNKLTENIFYIENTRNRMNELEGDVFSNNDNSHKLVKQLKLENNQSYKLLQKIKYLEDENQNLREQIMKSEKFQEIKSKDYMFQINKLKQDIIDIKQNLQSKIDSLIQSMFQQKKIYEEKLMKQQQDIEKTTNETQIKQKSNKQTIQNKDSENQSLIHYKQIIQQIQKEFDIKKENEIIPRFQYLVDKDMMKLIECLSDMMVQFAPDGFFEKKPTLKQIWKWLKEILKEYMKNTSYLQQAFIYVNAQKQTDFLIKLQKIVFENESYCKIMEQIKQYFSLDNDQFSNLYELQLFFEKKNSNKQTLNVNLNHPITNTKKESHPTV